MVIAIIFLILSLSIYAEDNFDTTIYSDTNHIELLEKISDTATNTIEPSKNDLDTVIEADVETIKLSGDNLYPTADQNISNDTAMDNIDTTKKTINTNSGLFLDFNIIGKFNPINIGFTVGAFYRFNVIKSSNSLFTGNYLDVGIENIFALNGDMVGLYVNFVPTIFMELNIAGYYNAALNVLDYGYIGIDNISNPPVLSTINSTKGLDANGYLISISPKFKWIFGSNVEIANTTTINFLSLGSSNFYLSRDTYNIYKKNDIEIINEFSLLTHADGFKVGPSYSLLYIVGTETFVHSLDLNIYFNKYFLNNRLRLYLDVKSGFYLASMYYQNSVFINIKLGIQYQIL